MAMATSFKKEAGFRPPRYRTPSPPRHVFEPISPTASEHAPTDLLWNQNTESKPGNPRAPLTPYHAYQRPYHQSYGSADSMDAFASIALATQPNPSKRPISEGHSAERPTKRAKSEKLASPDWSRKRAVVDPRPATSYEQSIESKLLEAELLLNFSTCARRASASSATLQPFNDRPRDDSNSLSYSSCHSPEQLERPLADFPIEGLGSLLDIHTPSPSKLHGELHQTKISFGQDVDMDVSSSLSVAADPGQNQDDFVTEDVPNSECKIDDNASASEDRYKGHESQDSRAEDQGPARGLGEDLPHEEQGRPQLHTDSHDSSENTARASDFKKPENTWQSPEQSNATEARENSEEDIVDNESRVIHGALGGSAMITNEHSANDTSTLDHTMLNDAGVSKVNGSTKTLEEQSRPGMATAICAACKFARNSLSMDNENNSTSWISCDGCKSWFHFACAGFKREREVRSVDKFRCKGCKPIHGSTTYVRKSSRAHSAIDYAGLHQGVIKTSDERPEHHYIQPIKDGTITFLPENFARMRPELVTAEFFEKGSGMKEPIVIPASLNPRPKPDHNPSQTLQSDHLEPEEATKHNENSAPDEAFDYDPDLLNVPDEGQDGLDMVMPHELSVRRVAELYGPEEKVEVIDVKSQNGEKTKWNMKRWVDYYENPNEKVVRNVISLEVSHSKLGRLIRRPKVVRDLDLQDSVWPAELLAKGEYPRVQFYCLMSVADCFTDFHIDFGGSSVFYHILKGKKTFLFIPPKEKHLKKYEEWCMSPAQNWTFLADQTKECYRVDLSEGDTMLIPSGWIHAVWTPEDSLVIGGNFLTRLNFGMQLRVAQVEKATGVARKFRYPHFQKLQWFTALRYLEDDPLPASVRDLLEGGGIFDREKPTYYEFDTWGENSRSGAENYHARYYSQSELDGLPELTRYLLRTALIDCGGITDGITAETRNAVKKSIPRGHGEPIDVVKRFAVWCAWKRGSEPIPHWAYPDAIPENVAPDKLSAAATKKLDREAALQAPRRHSARMQAAQQVSEASATAATPDIGELIAPVNAKRLSFQADLTAPNDSKRQRTISGTGSHRKTACESCRKRRRACKHKDQVEALMSSMHNASVAHVPSEMEAFLQSDALQAKLNAIGGLFDSPPGNDNGQLPLEDAGIKVAVPRSSPSHIASNGTQVRVSDSVDSGPHMKDASMMSRPSDQVNGSGLGSISPMHSRPRTKACNDCRKSKRRCIHDEFGNEDPVKVAETAIPRPHARKSNPQSSLKPSPKKPLETMNFESIRYEADVGQEPLVPNEPSRGPAPVANMVAVSSVPKAFEELPRTVNQGYSSNPELRPYIANTASHVEPLDGLANIEVPDDPIDAGTAKTITSLPNPTFGDSLPTTAQYTKESTKDNFTTTLSLQETSPLKDPYTHEDAAASSLVSPPASSHDTDMDTGPASPTNIPNPHSSPSSRQSSQPPFPSEKHQSQRYTPDSGRMRRASTTSTEDRKTTSIIEHLSPRRSKTVTRELGSGVVGNASEIVIEMANHGAGKGARKSEEIVADEESLRLIKELQAQDLGLRRRGGKG